MCKSNTFLISLIVIFLFTFGCDKPDETDFEPSVQLETPFENQSFNTFDTVFIIASITHNKNISRIELSVTDEDLKPVISEKVIDINERVYELDTFLTIDNKYIEHPKNYLLIKITADSKIYKYWYELHIVPLPKKLESILAVTSFNNNNSLYQIDLDGHISNIYNWPSDYVGGYGDSRNRLFYTSGGLIGGIRSFNFDDKLLEWLIIDPTIPSITAFNGTEGLIHVAEDNGYIESFNSTAMKVFRSDKVGNGKFTAIIGYGNFILASFKPFNSELSSLIVFNYPAGNIFAQTQFSGELISFVPLQNNNLLLITKEDGVNSSFVYSIANNSIVFYKELTSDSITSVSGDDRNIFISTDHSVIWYKPDSGSAISYLNIENITSLSFNPLDDQLFVGTSDKLILYNLPYTSPVSSYNLDLPVRDIELIYNK